MNQEEMLCALTRVEEQEKEQIEGTVRHFFMAEERSKSVTLFGREQRIAPGLHYCYGLTVRYDDGTVLEISDAVQPAPTSERERFALLLSGLLTVERFPLGWPIDEQVCFLR